MGTHSGTMISLFSTCGNGSNLQCLVFQWIVAKKAPFTKLGRGTNLMHQGNNMKIRYVITPFQVL